MVKADSASSNQGVFKEKYGGMRSYMLVYSQFSKRNLWSVYRAEFQYEFIWEHLTTSINYMHINPFLFYVWGQHVFRSNTQFRHVSRSGTEPLISVTDTRVSQVLWDVRGFDWLFPELDQWKRHSAYTCAILALMRTHVWLFTVYCGTRVTHLQRYHTCANNWPKILHIVYKNVWFIVVTPKQSSRVSPDSATIRYLPFNVWFVQEMGT